jgi:hypothetical protein
MVKTFGEIAVGTSIRLENCYGVKIEAIQCSESTAFYRSQNSRFDGWNFRYKFMGQGEENLMSLDDACEVRVIG